MQQLTMASNPVSSQLLDDYIQFSFDNEFEQEHCYALCYALFLNNPHCQLHETIDGADRTSYRLTIDDIHFTLHFEVYSQSCWLTLETTNNQTQLYKLFEFIKNN